MTSTPRRAGRVDVASVTMSLVAVLAVIFGLKQIAQDGIAPLPVATIVVGFAVGAAWARRQLTLRDPMIDLRLFRIPAFSASLVVNVLGIFVAVGYFLFVAQYLQLVVGLHPFAAGLWSLPSAIAMIVGSNVAPRLARRIRPPYLIGASLALAAIGLAILAQVGVAEAGGLAVVVVGSIVISLGLAPVFALTTDLIVGSAPADRAGAASGISETASELGGALGISVLGSIGVALYRSGVAKALPADVPSGAASAARDTLGAATAVAAQLPEAMGATVLAAARASFVEGMAVAAGISVAVAIAVAIIAIVALRNVGRTPEVQPEDTFRRDERQNLYADPVCAGAA